MGPLLGLALWLLLPKPPLGLHGCTTHAPVAGMMFENTCGNHQWFRIKVSPRPTDPADATDDPTGHRTTRRPDQTTRRQTARRPNSQTTRRPDDQKNNEVTRQSEEAVQVATSMALTSPSDSEDSVVAHWHTARETQSKQAQKEIKCTQVYVSPTRIQRKSRSQRGAKMHITIIILT